MDVDMSGRLWFASMAHGLVRVDRPESDHPRFVSFMMAEGLSSDSSVVIVHDLFGRVYAGTGRGLDRLDPQTGRVKHFTTTDGLASGQFRAAYRDQTGTLWFGTTGGLSRLVPAADVPTTPPRVLFTRIGVAGADRPLSALGEQTIGLGDLQSAQNSVALEYVGLEFGAGETVLYSYRLDGARNPEWSVPSPLRSLTLGNLAPGTYRAQIRAVNSQGVSSDAPAVVSFTILRPVWQRWWFGALAFAIVTGAAFAGYRYHVRRQVELANIRTRIAMDLHDDIGANLTKIAILSEVARGPHSAADAQPAALADIAQIARESVTSMGDIVWAINPQRERLTDLLGRMRLHAEEICSSHGLDVSFQAPSTDGALKLMIDVRRDLFLIFKEALNNVARHGGCQRVDILITLERTFLALTVADDGVGFDPSRAAEGQGLVSMRRRAASRGGTCHVLSSPGRGTRVSVLLPLSDGRTHLNT
jgi:signal transduction histidine kinase